VKYYWVRVRVKVDLLPSSCWFTNVRYKYERVKYCRVRVRVDLVPSSSWFTSARYERE
jgi:hypothetical protein